ncbi:hexokinase family protein-like protein [Halenospora varia]|nr:hexokinase family protein-like protein [Halenospora varia]
MAHTQNLDEFLHPLEIDIPKITSLAKSLSCTFTRLARESQEQFLSTPISDTILSQGQNAKGRFLAIDIGGTNLRVCFVELKGSAKSGDSYTSTNPAQASRVQRHLEKAWPIGEQLKNDKAEDLFEWVGSCIAEVVREGLRIWGKQMLPDEIPLGVTFSFPMIQHTLSEATLMSMGKGFAITSNLNLGKLLLEGYEKTRSISLEYLPKIKITAIVNDTIATLISFTHQLQKDPRRKAAMGLIVGTGCNATIPLALSKLHPSKKPAQLPVGDLSSDPKITVNTEWTIKGAAGPLHELGFITAWDKLLDSQGEAPGFQPFEYMTSGRYLGELGRLIILDFFVNHLGIQEKNLPPALQKRYGLTTSFLGNIGPHLHDVEPDMVDQIWNVAPCSIHDGALIWTRETADIVYKVAKCIQRRAAGMTAAAVVGLLACADEIHFAPLPSPTSSPPPTLANGDATQPGHSASNITDGKNVIEELMVGYTGGCIVHFQDYLTDCQEFIDDIMNAEFSKKPGVPKVVLMPCHDGGVMGAGILAGIVDSIPKS